MCFIKKCVKCGKKSWSGCGMHLENLFRKISYDERCWCNYEVDRLIEMINEEKKRGGVGPYPIHNRK